MHLCRFRQNIHHTHRRTSQLVVRSSEYLSRYRLDIRHKLGMDNVVPDALSRLPIVTEAKDHLVDRARSIWNKDLDGKDRETNPFILAYPIIVV